MRMYQYTFKIVETVVYEMTAIGTDSEQALDDALVLGLSPEDIIDSDITNVEVIDQDLVGEGV